MFASLKELSKRAEKEGFAIGAFNTTDLEVTQAICQAVSEMSAPVIIQTTPSAIEYAGLEQIFDIVENEIVEENIQAVLHLDHGKDWGVVKRCIDFGYPSVMFDGSTLDLYENIIQTKRVVEYAKRYKTSVEGELGVIAREGGKKIKAAVYTDPDVVCEFIEKTGIDLLAVSVGNEHGAPQKKKLDLDLLSEISKSASVPLVMHGSSGLTRHDIKEAIKLGVVKFNIDTNLRKAFVDGLKDMDKDEDDPRVIMAEVRQGVKKVVKEYIKIFGSEGKS